MYSLNNLSFGYQDAIFDKVTINIRENRVGIIGENGVGKTTLLKLLDGELVQNNGNIELNGKTYFVNFDLKKYHRFTIEDLVNISSKLKSFDCSNLDEYIELLNIEKYMKMEVGKLSKGTAKKVGLLIGLLTKDRILLLDEPFESLDEKTNENLVAFFQKGERRAIIVSHDVELLDRSVEAIYEVADKTLRVGNKELYE